MTCYLFSIENVFHNIHGMNNFYNTSIFTYFLHFPVSFFFFWTRTNYFSLYLYKAWDFNTKIALNRDTGKLEFKGDSLNNTRGVIKGREEKL